MCVEGILNGILQCLCLEFGFFSVYNLFILRNLVRPPSTVGGALMDH